MSASFLQLMKSAAPKRKGQNPRMTKELVNQMIANMPKKRSGRTAFIRRHCEAVNVKPVAFYTAKRRLLTGVR